MERLLEKQRLLTGYLEMLLTKYFGKSDGDNATTVSIITPSNPEDRGCQLSLSFSLSSIKNVHEELTKRGVVVSSFNIISYTFFTVNCLKVMYYISGSITHKFMKFLYLDYHSLTYTTSHFQYHSLSFAIWDASYKKSDIFTPTKHLDCNQLCMECLHWRLYKCNG